MKKEGGANFVAFLMSQGNGGESFQFWIQIWGGLSIKTAKDLIFDRYVNLDRDRYEKPIEELVTQISDTQYHNFACVYDGEKVTNYFDGQPVHNPGPTTS